MGAHGRNLVEVLAHRSHPRAQELAELEATHHWATLSPWLDYFEWTSKTRENTLAVFAPREIEDGTSHRGLAIDGPRIGNYGLDLVG